MITIRRNDTIEELAFLDIADTGVIFESDDDTMFKEWYQLAVDSDGHILLVCAYAACNTLAESHFLSDRAGSHPLLG